MPDRKWFKGTAAQAIDNFYGGPGVGNVRRQLERARDLLSSPDDFITIVEGLADSGEWNASDFPYPLPGGQLAGDEFERVARRGYLEAIGLALAHDEPVPVETFWMTGAGNDHFEMHVTDDREHVSVTLLVPEVDGGSQEEGMPQAWVVRVGSDGELRTHQTSGRHREHPPSRG
jgi:hypothetical protein